MAVKEKIVVGREFYADLLEAAMNNELERVTKLLSEIDDRKLQDLLTGCSNIYQLIRQVWRDR